MKNRIRHYRRQMGMTQTDLATRLGTTAATVSRLETDGIKISVDWLEPLADILQVPMTDLLDEPSPERIEMLGRIGPDGSLAPQPGDRKSGFVLRVPATRPVAAQLSQDIGPYRAGELVIGDRFDNARLAQGIDRDCLIGLRNGNMLLRRLAAGPKKGPAYALVPLQTGTETKYADRLSWCAPVVMTVRYF